MSQLPQDDSDNVMVLDEELETLSMDTAHDTVSIDPEGSALNRAPEEKYKPDEVGWTIPGLDEQYQKKEPIAKEEKAEPRTLRRGRRRRINHPCIPGLQLILKSLFCSEHTIYFSF